MHHIWTLSDSHDIFSAGPVVPAPWVGNEKVLIFGSVANLRIFLAKYGDVSPLQAFR
jgi:hypothetical protein